jgi:EpsD family peptidyl-prolyl cis-trans isomerase
MFNSPQTAARIASELSSGEARARREVPRQGQWVRAGRSVLFVALLGSALAACGRGSQNTATAPAGQVIAHVGKQDVTINELENEFRWAQVPADKRNDQTTKAVLGDLARRKYLAQKAITAGLDREPGVLLDTLRSREQILASAFVNRDVATKAAGIGNSDIVHYVDAHPLKFAKREVLTVEQVSIPLTANAQAAVEATKDAKSIDEIDQKLSAMGVLHNRTMAAMSSANLPEDFYNFMQTNKNDDVYFVRQGSSGIFFKVKAKEPAPLIGDDANKLARQLLVQGLLQEETSNKQPAADIEIKYEGDYARIMTAEVPANAPPGGPGNAPPEAPGSASPEAPASAPPEAGK